MSIPPLLARGMAIRAAIGHRFFTTCRNTDAKGLAVLDQSESVFASILVLSWHAWVAPRLSLAAAENPNMLTGAGRADHHVQPQGTMSRR
jgi:hypothetical protein